MAVAFATAADWVTTEIVFVTVKGASVMVLTCESVTTVVTVAAPL